MSRFDLVLSFRSVCSINLNIGFAVSWPAGSVDGIQDQLFVELLIFKQHLLPAKKNMELNEQQ